MPVTFDDIRKFDNGASFYTGDIHIHSFGASADVSDPQMTVEAIIESGRRLKISIISITDHNNDQNVIPSMDYGARYAG